MEKQILKSVHFKKLKCLNDVVIHFSDTLTAIMGVNGAGKTTVIHALACIYQPEESGKGENHKFPEFFIPTPDSIWAGSELYVVNEREDGAGRRVEAQPRKYCKDFDRWSPRYTVRPKRNVFYIGIDTCLPEIEKSNATSRITYDSSTRSGKKVEKTIQYASYILNKPYQKLLDNAYHNRHFSGVMLDSGLKYSSLSMGTGEQRILKILDIVLDADAYSLILIDEIDLLLHVTALQRLIEILYDISKRKHLQIIFTTHSTEMFALTKYVSIRFISNNRGNNHTFVYEHPSVDLFYSLTGKTERPIKIYVEDQLTAAVIRAIAKEKRMLRYVEVIVYGAICNAFTMAASLVIEDHADDYRLIVLDGDKYTSEDDKKEQIKKKLSGTEDDIEEKRTKALSLITEFTLPDGIPPEKFFYDVILKYTPEQSEINEAASEIYSISDTHEWLHGIAKKVGFSEGELIDEVFKHAASSDEIQQYIKNVAEWLDNTKERMQI